MECIADNVYVEVRQDAIRPPSVGCRASEQHRAALQYIIQNRGTARITVRLDFTQSSHIQLVLPAAAAAAAKHNHRHKELVLDIPLCPLQRRHAAHVIRLEGDGDGEERAFVRVESTVLEAETVLSDECPPRNGKWRDQASAALQEIITQSAKTYSAVNWDACATVDGRLCSEINRFFCKRQVHFVDPLFFPSDGSLYGQTSLAVDAVQHTTTWAPLHQVIDEAWCFVPSASSPTTWSKDAFPGQESWLCAINALHKDSSLWCKQWFGERQYRQLGRRRRINEMSVVHVSLFPQGKEVTQFVVDLYVPVLLATTDPDQQLLSVSSSLHGGLLTSWPHSGEFYAVLLHKAYAKRHGNYASIAMVPTRTIIQELTGVPVVQVFPGGEISSPASLVSKLGCIDSLAHKPSRTRQKDKVNFMMVSFEAIGDHHCTFELVGMEPSSSPSSSPLFVIRDAPGVLQHAIASELGVAMAMAVTTDHPGSDDGMCVEMTEECFVKLRPIVSEVLVDHCYSWRRRKVFSPLTSTTVTFQVAVSCASLQHLVIAAFATTSTNTASNTSRHMADGGGHLAVAISIDRVGEDGKWTRVELNQTLAPPALPHEPPSASHVQLTAAAGEYVVTLSLAATKPEQQNDNGNHTNSSIITSTSGIGLLFRCLDHDMDGLLNHEELVCFLRIQEGFPSSAGELSHAVDAFLDKYSTNTVPNSKATKGKDSQPQQRGLTQHDLLQVYEDLVAMATAQPNTTTTAVSVAELVQSDLRALLLGWDPIDRSSTTLGEFVCCVHSNENDIVISLLP